MSELRQIISTARPLRVAYLIDLDACPHELLDAVFAECYSRWGGRRTLIIPATENEGIHEDFQRWLYLYDPDIIYSYVNLADDIVAKIHETYCPLYLKKTRNLRQPTDTARDYFPDLSLEALRSVSVFPLLLDRRGLQDFSGSKILDCDYGMEPPRFLTDNFGTCLKSFRNSLTAEKYPEYYKALTLISESSYNNPRRARSDSREYETDFHAFINKVSSRTEKVITLSMLSDQLCWYLDFYSPTQSQTFNLVIGDTAQDRILFWNFHHHYTNILETEIVDLVVSPDDLTNADRMEEIREIIRNKSNRSQSGYMTTIRSFSQSEDQLNAYAEQLREGLPHAQINVQKLSVHSDYIPDPENNRERVYFKTGSSWHEPKSESKTNYSGQRVDVPEALPIHMKDLYVPPGLEYLVSLRAFPALDLFSGRP